MTFSKVSLVTAVEFQLQKHLFKVDSKDVIKIFQCIVNSQCLVVIKRSRILTQTCSWKLVFVSLLLTYKSIPSYCYEKLKEERKRFSKNCKLNFYAIIFGQMTFFSIIKLVFWGKRESYLFPYIFKDRVYLSRLCWALKLTTM